MISDFSFPNRTIFGPGAISQLPDLLEKFGAIRVLFIVDPGLFEISLFNHILELLNSRTEIILFNEVKSNPTESCIEAATNLFRSETCDFVVALGGGSTIDTAKATCLRLNHRLPFHEYEIQADGNKKIIHHVPKLIAIPTTAGTGSEVGRSAVVTLHSSNRKAIFFSSKLLPAVAICDPELTLDLPPQITAETGMDALSHNIEAYLSTTFHPTCDAIALGGIRLIAQNLKKAVKNGHELQARSNMMMAASMGAIAFQKDLGATHALAHPLSTLASLTHGLANAILLPHVMAFNKPVVKSRLKDVANAFGCNTFNASETEAAGLAIHAVQDLLSSIDIPNRLSETGVTELLISDLVAQAIKDPAHKTNPRPCTETDMIALYQAAL